MTVWGWHTQICHGSFELHMCFIRQLALGNFGRIFKRMVGEESLTAQHCLELSLEAGQCEFRGEFRLGAGAVLKRSPLLSFSYYTQVNAER